MSDRPTPRPLVSAAQVRGTFFLGGVGAVALILGLLLLSTARPQGRLVTVDDSQYQLQLQAAEAALTGFELVGDGARIDIGVAMQLVVERGVGQPIYAGGVPPVAAARRRRGLRRQRRSDGDVLAQADVDGAALYTQHCMACHQATGAGIPGAFPPIAGHIGELVAADRAYPAKLVLFGMMGAIEVKGTTYAGVMPGLGRGAVRCGRRRHPQPRPDRLGRRRGPRRRVRALHRRRGRRVARDGAADDRRPRAPARARVPLSPSGRAAAPSRSTPGGPCGPPGPLRRAASWGGCLGACLTAAAHRAR
jgi:mono/diheme cytochrome c family protein